MSNENKNKNTNTTQVKIGVDGCGWRDEAGLVCLY
jgi:hypothetical protein